MMRRHATLSPDAFAARYRLLPPHILHIAERYFLSPLADDAYSYFRHALFP